MTLGAREAWRIGEGRKREDEKVEETIISVESFSGATAGRGFSAGHCCWLFWVWPSICILPPYDDFQNTGRLPAVHRHILNQYCDYPLDIKH